MTHRGEESNEQYLGRRIHSFHYHRPGYGYVGTRGLLESDVWSAPAREQAPAKLIANGSFGLGKRQ